MLVLLHDHHINSKISETYERLNLELADVRTDLRKFDSKIGLSGISEMSWKPDAKSDIISDKLEIVLPNVEYLKN